jgi:hypothetical protein
MEWVHDPYADTYQLVTSAKKRKMQDTGQIERGMLAEQLLFKRLCCYLRMACQMPKEYEVTVTNECQCFSVIFQEGGVEIFFEADDHCSIRFKKRKGFRIDFHNDNTFYIEGALQYAHDLDIIKDALTKFSATCTAIMQSCRSILKKLPLYDNDYNLEIDAHNYLQVMWLVRRILPRDLRQLLWKYIWSGSALQNEKHKRFHSFIEVGVDF